MTRRFLGEAARGLVVGIACGVVLAIRLWPGLWNTDRALNIWQSTKDEFLADRWISDLVARREQDPHSTQVAALLPAALDARLRLGDREAFMTSYRARRAGLMASDAFVNQAVGWLDEMLRASEIAGAREIEADLEKAGGADMAAASDAKGRIAFVETARRFTESVGADHNPRDDDEFWDALAAFVKKAPVAPVGAATRYFDRAGMGLRGAEAITASVGAGGRRAFDFLILAAETPPGHNTDEVRRMLADALVEGRARRVAAGGLSAERIGSLMALGSCWSAFVERLDAGEREGLRREVADKSECEPVLRERAAAAEAG